MAAKKTKAPKKVTKPAKVVAKIAAPPVDKPKVYFAPPGVKANSAPTHPVVAAKCRRGMDRMTAGQNCDCITAENMTAKGSSTVQFRCTKCKYSWNVQMGAAFNIA